MSGRVKADLGRSKDYLGGPEGYQVGSEVYLARTKGHQGGSDWYLVRSAGWQLVRNE